MLEWEIEATLYDGPTYRLKVEDGLYEFVRDTLFATQDIDQMAVREDGKRVWTVISYEEWLEEYA